MRRFAPLLCLAVLAASGSGAELKVIFEDRFQEKPGAGWTWLKQDDRAWRVREGALELRVMPGGAPGNVLARTLPDPGEKPFAVEVTLTSVPQPTVQYEQVGFFWYANGKQGPKFVKERIDGKVYMFPGKKELTTATVQMRLVVTGRKFTGQYRPDAKGEFLTAFTGAVPAAEKGKLQIAINCYNGPKDAEHWIRFKEFRIVEVSER
jgi:hypothetical protein